MGGGLSGGDRLVSEVRNLLLAHGCVFVQLARMGHEIWRSPKSSASFSVPTGMHSRYTANAVLREAGIEQRM